MAKSDLEAQLQMQLIACGLGDHITREFRFHPVRKWRFDFAIVKYKIAIEVEGGVWVRGRHTRPAGFINDVEKYNEAVILGWRVIRVTKEHIESGKAIDWVMRLLNNSGGS